MRKPVFIGDILHRIKRPIDIDPLASYKLVTVKLYHKGVVLRKENLGADIKSRMYQVKAGDFILSGIDARNGAFGIVPPELDGAVVTNDFWYFEIDDEVVDKTFFLELTATHWFDEICRKGSDGTTQRIRLQKGKFFNQTIYLPELSEQRKFSKRFQAIKASSLALTSELTHQQTLLKKLRQQILQEAIEGKLTADWRAQNPGIEPASKLLKRIAAEKAQLVKDKKIKAQKPLLPITDEEKPFELPQGWEWSKIGEITSVITSGSRNWQSLYSDAGATFIRSQDIKFDRLCYANRAFVDVSKTKEGTRTLVSQYDWLIIITGANVGKCAYLYEPIEEAYVSQHVALMRPMLKEIGVFGHFWLISELGGRGLLSKFIYGDKPGLNLPQLRNLLIPIAPVDEQQAIVTKIEKLLSLCDQLETQISQNQTHAEQLMQAVLKEAFSHNSAAEPSAIPKATAHA